MDPIVIFDNPEDMTRLQMWVTAIIHDPSVYRVKFAIDEGGLKVKLNEYTWSPAIGRIEE